MLRNRRRRWKGKGSAYSLANDHFFNNFFYSFGKKLKMQLRLSRLLTSLSLDIFLRKISLIFQFEQLRIKNPYFAINVIFLKKSAFKTFKYYSCSNFLEKCLGLSRALFVFFKLFLTRFMIISTIDARVILLSPYQNLSI